MTTKSQKVAFCSAKECRERRDALSRSERRRCLSVYFSRKNFAGLGLPVRVGNRQSRTSPQDQASVTDGDFSELCIQSGCHWTGAAIFVHLC